MGETGGRRLSGRWRVRQTVLRLAYRRIGLPDGFVADPLELVRGEDVHAATGEHSETVLPRKLEGNLLGAGYATDARLVTCGVWRGSYDTSRPRTLWLGKDLEVSEIGELGDRASYAPMRGAMRVQAGPVLFQIVSVDRAAPKIPTADALAVTAALAAKACGRITRP